ncbi:MAG TPA: insulinase family protein [Leptolyngbyaceae cyanobacterium M65_K2018_010]|nr:insulinase family protein [Leptolyngbyaceae cyanobacterium M65_K2018_010]
MPLLSAPADPSTLLVSPTLRCLPNGLTIIAEQMPLEVVNLSLWLRVGSAHESDAINGMAHFLEHMIFKGTETLATGDFERLVEERGALTNAATSQDYTKYYITTAPKDFADLAPWQIQLVMNPRLGEQDFERERPVILEEIRRAGDNPQRRTYARSMEMAFERLPYRRPVLGPKEVIERLSVQQMREFHRTWYQPQNITAVAVGNLPVEELIAIVAEGFEQAASPPGPQFNPHLGIWTEASALALEPPFAEIQQAIHTDPTLTQARLTLTWRVPGLMHLEDTYGLDILASILGRGRTSRLVRDLREERKLVTSIGCSNLSLAQQGVFMVSAKLAPEHLEAVEQAIVGHIRTLIAEPVSPAELKRVQTQVSNQFVFANETPSDRAGLYGFYHTLTGNIADGLDYPNRIQRVDINDLQQAARQHLCPEAYGLVTIHPTAT